MITEQGDTELPKAVVKRLVKARLSQFSGLQDAEKEYQINKDALLAFSESAKVFISYIAATANDICKEAKRQTLNVEDVFKALEDMEFQQFVPPLRQFLEEYKKTAKEKNEQKAELAKKRKERGDTTIADGPDHAVHGDAAHVQKQHIREAGPTANVGQMSQEEQTAPQAARAPAPAPVQKQQTDGTVNKQEEAGAAAVAAAAEATAAAAAPAENGHESMQVDVSDGQPAEPSAADAMDTAT